MGIMQYDGSNLLLWMKGCSERWLVRGGRGRRVGRRVGE